MMKKNGVGDWNPPVPTEKDSYMKLLGTVAKDNPDALNGTNELKNFVGKKGAQSEPGGIRGREF